MKKTLIAASIALAFVVVGCGQNSTPAPLPNNGYQTTIPNQFNQANCAQLDAAIQGYGNVNQWSLNQNNQTMNVQQACWVAQQQGCPIAQSQICNNGNFSGNFGGNFGGNTCAVLSGTLNQGYGLYRPHFHRSSAYVGNQCIAAQNYFYAHQSMCTVLAAQGCPVNPYCATQGVWSNWGPHFYSCVYPYWNTNWNTSWSYRHRWRTWGGAGVGAWGGFYYQ